MVTGVWSQWKVYLLEPKCPALITLRFCQHGVTLKNEWMTLSRTLKRMCDQRLTAAYRPIWSLGLFELNLTSLYPPALETAVCYGMTLTSPPCIWHVTRDTWHLTCDMWHVTHGEGWTFSPNFSSLVPMVWYIQCLEVSKQKDHLLNEWMNESKRCL